MDREGAEHDLRIRLRGVGCKPDGGSKGWGSQINKQDPLQQCISCTDHSVFVNALYETKIILQRIYKER